MEDIYLDNELNVQQIKNCLLLLFPDLEVFYYDFNDFPSKDLVDDNPDQIFFNKTSFLNKKEFKFKISIYRTPNENYEERQIYIGQQFSNDFNVRVIVAFKKPDDPSNPFYNLVFENGKIYLADDNDTSFADCTEGLVKIIKEYNLPKLKFDRKANFIK
jgi:hypothetical protein